MAAEELFENVNLIELFDFSRISERMRSFVQEEVEVEDMKLIISIDDGVAFDCYSVEDDCILYSFTVEAAAILEPDDQTFSWDIGDYTDIQWAFLEPLDDDYPTIGTYWDDYFVGAKAMYKELTELFRLPIKKVVLKLPEVGARYQEAVHWINELGLIIPVPRVVVLGSNVDFEVYLWTLENLRTLFLVDFQAKPTKPQLVKDNVNLDIGRLWIHHGGWVKPCHLKTWTVPHKLFISRASLTVEEANRFFRDVKRGQSPRLKDFHLWFLSDLTVDILNGILKGLRAKVEESDGENYLLDFDNGDHCRLMVLDHMTEGLGVVLRIERKESAQAT